MFVAAHLHLPRMRANNPNMISVKPKFGLTYYVPELKLVDVDFKVNPNGRQRTIANNSREVHAWVRGTVTDELGHGYWQMARYNPFECETFVNVDTGRPVHTARFAFIHGKDVYYVS